MQHGEHDINARGGAPLLLPGNELQDLAFRAGHQRERRAVLWNDKGGRARSASIAGVTHQPAAVLGQTNQNDIVFAGVEGPQHVCGGCP